MFALVARKEEQGERGISVVADEVLASTEADAVALLIPRSACKLSKNDAWHQEMEKQSQSDLIKPVGKPVGVYLSKKQRMHVDSLCRPVISSSLGLHPDATFTVMAGAQQEGIGKVSSTVYTAQLVDTESQLLALAAELSVCCEVAFDAEMHHWRSYYGLTCTLQLCGRRKGVISTIADQAYVVDCIALWDVIPTILGPLFANPSILKVGFAICGDCISLFKDFGIVMINAVCLQVGTEILTGQNNIGLAGMLVAMEFPDDVVEKMSDSKNSLRAEDWRIRPLRDDMLEYAIGDVIYLIPTYHRQMSIIIAHSRKKCASATNLGNVESKDSVQYTPTAISEDIAYSSILTLMQRCQRDCLDKSALFAFRSAQVRSKDWMKEKGYKAYVQKFSTARQKKSQQGAQRDTTTAQSYVSAEMSAEVSVNAVQGSSTSPENKAKLWNAVNDKVFSVLFEWRELKAAHLDESPSFLIATASLLLQAHELPSNVAEVEQIYARAGASPWLGALKAEQGGTLKLKEAANELFELQKVGERKGEEDLLRAEQERQQKSLEKKSKSRRWRNKTPDRDGSQDDDDDGVSYDPLEYYNMLAGAAGAKEKEASRSLPQAVASSVPPEMSSDKARGSGFSCVMC